MPCRSARQGLFGRIWALAVLVAVVSACLSSPTADDPPSVQESASAQDDGLGQGADGAVSDGSDGAQGSATAGGDDSGSEESDTASSDAGEASDAVTGSAAAGSGDSAGESAAGVAGIGGSDSCELVDDVGCEGVDGDLEAPLLGPGEALAFLSDRGEGLEWFVVDRVGSRARQITAGLKTFEWSPDRSRLAYTTASGLVVVDADGSDRRMLVEGTASWPNWSPDGAEIAYTLQADADAPQGDSPVIHVVEVEGSGQRELARGQKPQWSPDGTQIMYQNPVGCCSSSGGELWATSILDLDSGDTYTIDGEFREGHIGRVAALWSPDGTMVAYTHRGDIYLLPLYLLRNGDHQSEYLNLGMDPLRLVAGGRALSWSPDGFHLAYLSSDAFCAGACDELWITEDDGYNQTYLANARYGTGFEWSPDGMSIAFVSEWAGGLKLVDIASASGSEELVTMPLPGSFAPSWSPDGSRIAFASEDVEYDDLEDDADIYIATADGTRLVRLTEDRHHNVEPTWIQLPATDDSPTVPQPTVPESEPTEPTVPEPEPTVPESEEPAATPEEDEATVPVASDDPFSEVSVGANHSCGLRASGVVDCWGSNSDGQSDSPESIFSAVSAGGDHSCGLRADGGVECWGLRDAPEGEFMSVSAGRSHSCGLRASGEIECWGSNSHRQSDAPEGVFSAVSAGRSHSCGLRASGVIECWGSRSDSNRDAPSGVLVAVSAGDDHSCGLRADGGVECWGQSDVPEGEFMSVTAGGYHSCGLRPSGAIECWGLGSDVELDAPEGVFSAVSAGDDHSCGLRASGVIECWGEGLRHLRAPDGPFFEVSVGHWQSCGVHSDGLVQCWRFDSSGQWFAVSDLPDVPGHMFISVSAGGFHSCGLRISGNYRMLGRLRPQCV